MEKLNLTVAEGYPSRNTETAGLLRDQFVKPPTSSKWYDTHTDKKDSKLNSVFSRVARHSLPAAPHSRALSQDILRRWERTARELSAMCNQAAGLSRCLTRVQDAMSTQLNNKHSDKGKGKSISQVMASTMQDLSEGIFISVANFTVARRDSYLECLHAGVKQHTLTSLRTAPVHLQSLFQDQFLIRAEKEVARSEERLNWTGSRLSQLGSKYANASRERKVVASLPLSHRNRPRVLNLVNDNYCVKCVTGLKDCVCVPGQRGLTLHQ